MFLSPLWLFGLIPWTALAVWMLWGRRPAAVVPFIDLWRGPVTGKYVERSIHPPPRAIAMILLATALAIVAAASPVVRGRGGARVTVVVDRGITMSATGSSQRRYVEASTTAAAALRDALGRHRAKVDRLHIVAVPNGAAQQGSIKDWPSFIAHLPPTAADTRLSLAAAVARERSESDLVIIVSDQPTGFRSDETVQVSPTDTPRNVGIVTLAARQSPAAQLMLRLRNDSDLTHAQLTITTSEQRLERKIDLPPRGEQADAFINLPKLDDVVHATIAVDDALAADNEAWLVRERAWPVIEVRTDIPPALARMIAVYTRQRPPGGDASQTVAVVQEAAALGRGEQGVVLAGEGKKPSQDKSAVMVADHPLTQSVSWDKVLHDAALSPAPADWTPIVSVGGSAVLATREQDGRRVWVGFDSEPFARSTDYVVFWTNVFDWLSGGGEAFTAHPVAELLEQWQPVALAGNVPPPRQYWPGLYRRGSDGQLRAVNAPAPRFEPAADAGWRRRLDRIIEQGAGRNGLRLSPWLLLSALACLLAGAVWWPGVGLTRFSGGRTV